MRDASKKLMWARSRHERMVDAFVSFARPGGGDERPYGVHFDQRVAGGPITAKFIAEQSMPDEMSLLAADLVHNTRTALDHVLARLKEAFGGDVGSGSFPTSRTQQAWDDLRHRRSDPLAGLDQGAIDFIYAQQPLHHEVPEADPLVIVNALDNADKHRLLQPAYAYPQSEIARGIDLVDARADRLARPPENRWERGQPLDHDTVLANYLVRGPVRSALRVNPRAEIGFATGPLDGRQTTYQSLMERVEGIVAAASALVDAT